VHHGTSVLTSSALFWIPVICVSIRLLLRVSNLGLPREPPHVCSHLLLDELQTPIYGHNSLSLVLLQQHGADLLVDVRIVIKDVEFLERHT
jgi:hypothetical protein